jgi:hypothetical protein
MSSFFAETRKRDREEDNPWAEDLPADLVEPIMRFLTIYDANALKRTCAFFTKQVTWRGWARLYCTIPHVHSCAPRPDVYIRALLYLAHHTRDERLHKFVTTRVMLREGMYAEYVQYAAEVGVLLHEPFIQALGLRDQTVLYLAGEHHLKNVVADFLRATPYIRDKRVRSLVALSLGRGDVDFCDWVMRFCHITFADGLSSLENEYRVDLYHRVLLSSCGLKKVNGGLRWLRAKRVSVARLGFLGVPSKHRRAFLRVFRKELRNCKKCGKLGVSFDAPEEHLPCCR